jgi:FdrA protein
MLGLFSGGTLCAEAGIILGVEISTDGAEHPPTVELIDLGDDRFTSGRPHPMIDPRDRALRIRTAAEDPSVAVILLDVVLGYGSHADPAGVLAPAIQDALELARRDGRELSVVASVCGTDADPQNRALQHGALRAAGAQIAPSNAAAARMAGRLAAPLPIGGNRYG